MSCVLILAHANSASAKTWGSVFTSENGVGAEANKDAAPSTTRAKPSTPSTPQPVCTYQAIPDGPNMVTIDGNQVTPLYDSTHSSATGTWMFKECTDAAGNTTLKSVWVPKANPAALAQQVISEAILPQPQIATSPAPLDGAVVNFPTWLWIDKAQWQPISANASVDGYTVTATASPHAVTWNMGDGHTLVCNGPGAAYDISLPDSSQHSTCTYSYTRSSASQPTHRYTLTASVRWDVTWQASDGTSGTLDSITRTTSVDIPVREIQSINVAPAGGW